MHADDVSNCSSGHSPFSLAITQANSIVETALLPKVPGCSVAVAINGKMAWSAQFGYADLRKKTPVTPQTRFRVGSVSKPFTAAGLALLVERGKIDLDAPVQNYIPDFPHKEGVITTRLLAGHLSGIRNYRGREATLNEPFADLRSGLKLFESDSLETTPGTKFNYSSYNWNFIGAIIEAVTKQDFPSYMDENVFKPLGLSDTRPDLATAVDPQCAAFYEKMPDGSFCAPPVVNASYKWPGGGYLSTADDMVQFGSAHLQPGFLKPETLQMLFTSQTTTSGTPTNNGIGWFIGRKSVYHGGDILGGTAILMLVPSFCLAVGIACNTGVVMLSRLLSTGKADKEAQRFNFNKELIAAEVAKVFMMALKESGTPSPHSDNADSIPKE